MNLTKAQRRGLQAALTYRAKPPTLAGLLRPHALAYVSLLVFAATVSVGLYVTGAQVAAAFIAGVTVGGAARVLAGARNYVRMWPLTAHITHWPAVAALLAQDGVSSPIATESAP